MDFKLFNLFMLSVPGTDGTGVGATACKIFLFAGAADRFYFSIIGEELGLIGGCTTILLFFLLLWRGIKIAIEAPDLFSRLLALGIASMLALQAMINISVVIGLIPVTGITLPFLSYGGSSLTLTLCAAGILLSISRHAKSMEKVRSRLFKIAAKNIYIKRKSRPWKK